MVYCQKTTEVKEMIKKAIVMVCLLPYLVLVKLYFDGWCMIIDGGYWIYPFDAAVMMYSIIISLFVVYIVSTVVLNSIKDKQNTKYKGE